MNTSFVEEISNVFSKDVESLRASLKGAELSIIILSVCFACLACGFSLGIACYLFFLRRGVRVQRVEFDDEDEQPKPRPSKRQKEPLDDEL